MISYPATLPQPSTDFAGDVSASVIRTELKNGLVEQEGRFSNALETFRLSWTLSADELIVFEEWFNETLVGGVLVFALMLPEDGGYINKPVRFVGGKYEAAHKGALWYDVSAIVEHLSLTDAPSNRTPPVPQFLRLGVDPTATQVLTLSHRNALLTVRPGVGSTTTLRIFPPTSKAAWLYFGINNQGLGETLITSQDVDPIIPAVTPDFPAELPAVNQTFSQSAERGVARVEMESGWPRQIGAKIATVKTYLVEWEFSLEELQTFQDFFFITLKSGGLPFILTLPVDGAFAPVAVRIQGGTYSEAYVPVDRFKVQVKLDAMVEQTVVPEGERPYPLYYSPSVNVSTSRKIYTADAGKMFVVNPAAGQTIYLYIGPRLIEFGVLIIGLGNVQITRQPYPLDIGSIGADGTGTTLKKPSFEIISVIKNIGSIGSDSTGTTLNKPTFEIITTAKPIGTIPADNTGTVLNNSTFEIKVVLRDVGTIPTDNCGTVLNKPTFSID